MPSNQGFPLEHTIQLNDGPLDGVELVVDNPVACRIRSITAEVALDEDKELLDDSDFTAAKYDLYLNEPTASGEGCDLCFYHEESKLLPNHPLAKLRNFLSENDREFWDEWVFDVSMALDACFENMTTNTRDAAEAAEQYRLAKRRLSEVPKLVDEF